MERTHNVLHIDIIAARTAYQNVEVLATSALPHAPIIPERQSRPRATAVSFRLTISTALHRVADAVEPAQPAMVDQC
jgi:hypothetical protein